jgi:hypothetical protein
MTPPEQPTLSEIKTEKETRKVLILQVGLISVVILLEDVDTVIGWRKERFTQRARKHQ